MNKLFSAFYLKFHFGEDSYSHTEAHNGFLNSTSRVLSHKTVRLIRRIPSGPVPIYRVPLDIDTSAYNIMEVWPS